jgi:hypothetical protein
MTAITPVSAVSAPPDVTSQDIADLALVEFHRVRMMFYPPAWASAPTDKHSWVSTDFPPDPRTIIPKQPGVYVFVVKTNLFDFPHASGLFYVGKAKNLYERVGAYMSDTGTRILRTKRPLVWRMLNAWRGHLKYFYTTTTDVASAEALENQMLNAFIPPFNRQFEGETSQTVRAFL